MLSNILYNDNNAESEQELANAMGKYWVNFAYSGDPNEGPYSDLVKWKNWTEKNQRYIVFDSSNDQGIAMRTNTDSGTSLLQDLSSEPITIKQKCTIVDRILINTTLSLDSVNEIYKNFLNGKCIK